jgi:hypothetical protein
METPGQEVSTDLRFSWAPAVNEDAAQIDFHVKDHRLDFYDLCPSCAA